MSPQAIADPEDLERFARELKRFSEELSQARHRLQAHFIRLGETWRDQEHQKFAGEFEQAMRVLIQFRRASDEQIPILLAKAGRLRDYLNR
jgi:uncharacterized protein YukE